MPKLNDKDKVTDFFLMDIKTSCLMHFEAHEWPKQIYDDQFPNQFQTKLHKGFYNPLICSHFPWIAQCVPLAQFLQKHMEMFL